MCTILSSSDLNFLKMTFMSLHFTVLIFGNITAVHFHYFSLIPLMAHEYVLYVTFVASKSFYGTRTAMPRKTCQLRLSRNSTKFYVLARFRETIPTVKSVSPFEI